MSYLAIRKGGFGPLLLLALWACQGCVATPLGQEGDTADPELPNKVLFVGNSFTYYNNSLHKHFRLLTYSAGLFTPENSRARIKTISGARLPEHAGGFERVLSAEDWDVVVMQGHSLGPISEDTAEPFREAAREFSAFAREQGTQPVFFMTWAYTGQPEMTALIDKAYTDIGRELDAEVVPVGLAFAKVTAERPDIALRIADKSHPSRAGTYLAACTFFAALYQQTPEGLDYDAGLDEKTAVYLQKAAWQTVQNYKRREMEWTFSGWAGPPVPVRAYVPLQHDASTPIVIVMHGASRDAPRYYEDWRALAESQGFIVAVPYLSKDNFPGSESYNLGNMLDAQTGEPSAIEEWTFSLIEPLFDEIVSRVSGEQKDYVLYGHSAGSQFAHRLMFFVPELRASKFIAANAGWYTMPDFSVEYPYGLKNSGIAEEDVPAILAQPLTVLLGSADVDINADKLRKTPEAEAQGANRLERGQAMFLLGRTKAEQLGVPFNWKLLIVKGADHDNAKMAPAAATLIH